jgi:hypothetical protein
MELGEYYVVGYKDRRYNRIPLREGDNLSRGRILKAGLGCQYQFTNDVFFDFSGKYQNEGEYPHCAELMAGIGVEL